jgi:hypothetical protein
MGNTLPYAFLERIQMILPDIHHPSLLSTSYTHFCEKVSFSEKGKRKGNYSGTLNECATRGGRTEPT